MKALSEDILLFYPQSEQSNADQIAAIINGASIVHTVPCRVVFCTEESYVDPPLIDIAYTAVVILYTQELELSETLFHLLKEIEINPMLTRFFFLPLTGEKKEIPVPFHSLRQQQHKLYYYQNQQPLDLTPLFDAFKRDFDSFINPNSNIVHTRSLSFTIIVIISIISLFIIVLISIVVPMAKDVLFVDTPTSVRPQSGTAFWLRETFVTLDTVRNWQASNPYNGDEAIRYTISDGALQLSAFPVVNEATFQLDSQESWPLDQLQSLSFSFFLASMADPEAIAGFSIEIYLTENENNRLSCHILSEKSIGKVQCIIQESDQKTAISNPETFSYNDWHTTVLVFDPLTYSLQFFLDDNLYGKAEIQSVEFWRTRQFKLRINNQLQNLNTGKYSCILDTINLAHQP